jgi:phosphoglycerate kinase
MPVRTLDDVDVSGRRVLVRADLNVPLRDGKIRDLTRIERLTPTIRELISKGAKVIIASHFDRPRGKRVRSMSLAPVAQALAEMLGQRVLFAEDCIGLIAEQAVGRLRDGEVLLLENTRFHPGEEQNDPAFAGKLAALAQVFVNDAFSAAHRAHASTEGVARIIPAYAGRLMQAEVSALEAALTHPERPVLAIVGGSKVSTKIELLGNLVSRVGALVVGGAMANTFLAAEGIGVGASLEEKEMHQVARGITARAARAGCEIVLPTDAVAARKLAPNVPTETVPVSAVPEDAMILDVGPNTTAGIINHLRLARTLVWNGPVGAFETPPFGAATLAIAHAMAELTRGGSLKSVAGGGDTVSALRQAGVADQLSYVSTAGGAFLEWLEGKTLPGVAALEAPA